MPPFLPTGTTECESKARLGRPASLPYALTMPFECRIPVRFGDIDIAKIVYYPRFLHFCHVAMEEFFGAVVGVPYHETVMREKVGYPTVKAEAEYLKPVGFGEVIRMVVYAEHVGTSSVRLRYEGYRTSDGELPTA